MLHDQKKSENHWFILCAMMIHNVAFTAADVASEILTFLKA